MDKNELTELLAYIPCSECSYQEWLSVGMALKHEGCDVDVWNAWSQTDPRRYRDGDCVAKWRSFRGAASPVTGGTIVQMAKDHGWTPAAGGEAYDWDDVIGDGDDVQIVRQDWVEAQELQEPGDDWDPARQIIDYLQTLFRQDDFVGYVTETWEKDGRRRPGKGSYDRTAGQLIRELERCGGDIGSVFGDYKREDGAWIRFNPLDGAGVKNENVADFRYALVESDAQDLGQQQSIIRELELPVACMVFSGKKSVHAIVRIDAASYDEYRKRVDYLYKVCAKNGLKIDTQNKNPSRLSRLPGVWRGEHKQYLIATNIGQPGWDEWVEWVESVNDDLPDPEALSDVWNALPELAPCLIDGILRRGHKMLLTGPSKAGKSFALIELCIAIAEGKEWLGFACTRGRVLYVNLELDRASCLRRFRDVYAAKHWQPVGLANIDVWNLRGNSVPMDKLAPKLIRRARKKGCAAVVIDPIYKVITGDENDAYQMSLFCNQFDRICRELEASVIICHHHSKGFQGNKRSRDRSSGSGVFARDPDAVLDLIELQVDEAKAAGRTAWRLEGDLREFRAFQPVNVWFDYPTHPVDEDGQLRDAAPIGDTPAWSKASQAKGRGDNARRERREKELSDAYNRCADGGTPVTVNDIMRDLGISRPSAYGRIDSSRGFERMPNGQVWRRDLSGEKPPFEEV